MMGDRLVMQESLFYEFCVDEFVPSDHMLRAIDRFIDLSDLRRHLGPFYSSMGRPSIDPESACCSSAIALASVQNGDCARKCSSISPTAGLVASAWKVRSRTIPRFPRTATAASEKATPS